MCYFPCKLFILNELVYKNKNRFSKNNLVSATNNKISKDNIKAFHTEIFSWWSTNKRKLPWRETTDPYAIMVSEFMLQQTQVSRVIPKYLAFLEAFPSIELLSKASRKEVLRLWSGLGYNRRAVWLQEAAKSIFDLGYFPLDHKELKTFKGIGTYTSRAIPIFALNEQIATIDTNIKKILLFHGFISVEQSESQILTVAEQLVPTGQSRDYHNALMDYGSVVKSNQRVKPKNVESKFIGSTRHIRGLIIKQLVQNNRSSVELVRQYINEFIDVDEIKFKNIVAQLLCEGLIDIENNEIFI
jgi:A/G-specific adenine glycosylase